jgi:L-lactate dehydrogenase complex protein LldE
MVRAHFPDLFADDPVWRPKADDLAGRTYELTQFLVDVMGRRTVAPMDDSVKTQIALYHDSCSGLRELGVKAQPRALLAQVAGLTMNEMEEAEVCCGFGGAFAVKFGDISAHIADRKCDSIAAARADAVVLGDLGCMLNIEGRLRRRGDMTTRVLHVAEVLAGVSE